MISREVIAQLRERMQAATSDHLNRDVQMNYTNFIMLLRESAPDLLDAAEWALENGYGTDASPKGRRLHTRGRTA